MGLGVRRDNTHDTVQESLTSVGFFRENKHHELNSKNLFILGHSQRIMCKGTFEDSKHIFAKVFPFAP